jgi:hypothetical protein
LPHAGAPDGIVRGCTIRSTSAVNENVTGAG